MTRNLLIAASLVAVVILGGALYLATATTAPDEAAATEPSMETPEADPQLRAADDTAGQTGSPDQAMQMPSQARLEELREIADRYGGMGGADPAMENDEVALDAPRVDPADTMNDEFVAEALSQRDFDAERVVAVIDASPRLTLDQKAELRRAIQVVSQHPEARSEMLPLIERMLTAES